MACNRFLADREMPTFNYELFVPKGGRQTNLFFNGVTSTRCNSNCPIVNKRFYGTLDASFDVQNIDQTSLWDD